MLTIHVGLPKTGSTALQSDLTRMSRHELSGVHYRGLHSNAHNDGFMSYEKADRGFRVPNRLHKSIPTIRLLNAGKHVVLSEESFLGLPVRPHPSEMWGRASHHVAAMRDYFQDSTPFQIVIWLRYQPQWLESLYNEHAKTTGYVDRFEALDFAEQAMAAPNFRWTNLINELKGQLGSQQLIVRAYRPELNVTSQFLEIIGASVPQHMPSSLRVNESLTPQHLAILGRLNHAAPPLSSTVKLLLANAENEKSTHSYSFFPEEIQARLERMAANDWQSLATTVANTHLAEPHHFLAVARDAQQSQINPYLGSLDDLPIDEEVIRILTLALPYVRSHPRNLPSLLKSFTARVRYKAYSDPTGIPRSIFDFCKRLKL